VRVLYLEDEVIICMMIHEVLESFGCHVIACTTLTQAREAAAGQTFDVALLDVNVHNLTSYPVAELLDKRGTAVAFLTGYQSRALEKPWDVYPYCEKPCTESDLKGLVGQALAGRRHALDNAPR
jgi:CheY-like chemotaxis protein